MTTWTPTQWWTANCFQPLFRAGRWRLFTTLNRWRRAIAYARDRLSEDDAAYVLYDCQVPAGRYTLLVLDTESAAEEAIEQGYHDTPELRRLVDEGCQHVGSHWESYGDELYEARRWAISKAEEYAETEGIVLTRVCPNCEGGGCSSCHVGPADGAP